MRYELADLSAPLSLPPRYFLTREKGEAAYAHLFRLMNRLTGAEPLVLIFPPEQLMDASFADEAIVRLYEVLIADESREGTLLLMGLTPDSLHNLNAVIHLRNLKLAILVVDEAGGWQLIGQLEQSLRQTLEMLAIERTLTAPQLAEHIDSAVNTASNRLKRLYDARLVRREQQRYEQGIQYIYHFWEWGAR